MATATTDLAQVRAALDEARHNGWREVERVAAEMEEYVSAVRASRRGARVVAGGGRASSPPVGMALP